MRLLSLMDKTFTHATTIFISWALVTLTSGSLIPTASGDDFHFPAEEHAEARAAYGVLNINVINAIDATNSTSGSLTLSVRDGAEITLTTPGDSVDGWTLRSFIVRKGRAMAILERDWNRWGLILYLELAPTTAPLGSCFCVKAHLQRSVGCFVVRKGVGIVSQDSLP